MAVLPRDLPTPAATPAADDYVQLDGVTNLSRKFLATQWAFKASPAFTGTPTAPTPSGATPAQLVTVDYLPTAMGVLAVKNAAYAALMPLLYPVGEILITHRAGNPNTWLGFGTWVAFAAGKVLIGLDTGDATCDAIDETGGSKTHTIGTANLPAHTHGVGTLTATAVAAGGHSHNYVQDSKIYGSAGGPINTTYATPAYGSGVPYNVAVSSEPNHTHTINLAGSTSDGGWGATPINHQNPYITVAMWLRTA